MSRTFETLRVTPHDSSVSPQSQTVLPRVSHLPRQMVTPERTQKLVILNPRGRQASWDSSLILGCTPNLITLIFVTKILSLCILHFSDILIKHLSEKYGPLACRKRDV